MRDGESNAPSRAAGPLRSGLELEEFAADSGALVVCAYRGGDGDAAPREHAGCAHPHHLGSRPASPAFQVYRTGKDGWTVSGVVDADGAPAFAAVLRTLLRQAATVRLLCHALDFLDAAGMSALAYAADTCPTARSCWKDERDRTPGLGAVRLRSPLGPGGDDAVTSSPPRTAPSTSGKGYRHELYPYHSRQSREAATPAWRRRSRNR